MTSTRSSAIPYVPLDPSRAELVDPPFLFVRWQELTFVNAASDAPHRHDFHELLLIESGRMRHSIDGQTTDVGAHTLSFITRGQVHLMDRLIGVTGWQLRFADEFLPARGASIRTGPICAPFLALTQTELATLAPVADLIEVEYARVGGPERDAALRHLLALLLLRIDRITCDAGDALPAAHDAQELYRAFVEVLERDFTRHRDVAHYARELAIDPTRLSAVLNAVLGMPAKRVIDDRLVLEAKRLLRHTPLSVKEIAAELGYSDQFHLSKVFKRLTGISPQEYRDHEKVT